MEMPEGCYECNMMYTLGNERLRCFLLDNDYDLGDINVIDKKCRLPELMEAEIKTAIKQINKIIYG